MKAQQEFKDDRIRQYLDPEMIEKAPSGFTDKVMTMVSLETKPVKEGRRWWRENYIPLISLAVTLILAGIAFSLPSSGNDFITIPGLKMFHSIDISMMKVNLNSLLKFRLPGYLPYLLISILFLSIFDRALSGIFHGEKKR